MACKRVNFFAQSAPDEGGLHMSLCCESGIIGGIEDVETLLKYLHGVKGSVVAYIDELDVIAPDIVAYMVDVRGAVESDGRSARDKQTFVSTDGKTYYKVLESTRNTYTVDDRNGGVKYINRKQVTNHYDRYLDAQDSFFGMCSTDKWASLRVLYDNKTIELRSWRRIIPVPDEVIMAAAGESTLCVAVMRLVERFKDLGVDLSKCLTIGQAAIRSLTDSMGGKTVFSANFPEIEKEVHDKLTLAYYGGLCSVRALDERVVRGNHIHTAHTARVDGHVVDCNSMYMAMVRNRPMPYGEVREADPRVVDAWIEYKLCGVDDGLKEVLPYLNPASYDAWSDNFHFVGGFCMEAAVKDDREPSLHQPDRGMGHIIARTLGEEEVFLSRPDLERVARDYKHGPIRCTWAYTFKCRKPGDNACVPYIDYWYGLKAQFKADGNEAGRLLCKLMLNNVTGKFAQRKEIIEGHFTEMTDNGPAFEARAKETKASYIPLAIYLTAYARTELLEVVHANWEHVLYIDTDGVHMSAAPQGVNIGDGIGEWKIESVFDCAAYYAKKTYIEAKDGVMNIKMSGANKEVIDALVAAYGPNAEAVMQAVYEGVQVDGKVRVHRTRSRRWKTHDGVFTLRPKHIITAETMEWEITKSDEAAIEATVKYAPVLPMDDDGWTNPFAS